MAINLIMRYNTKIGLKINSDESDGHKNGEEITVIGCLSKDDLSLLLCYDFERKLPYFMIPTKFDFCDFKEGVEIIDGLLATYKALFKDNLELYEIQDRR